ncbi:MAG TPA: hypothetical protein VME63_18315 [Dyella sp.]|uniref:hypothetical protein n=1 Tax=Dyella sp. TaxID=1869338 RepID=UPI002C865765|nr:hypothetical protein [Dyella sp.]HTV87355.1 hypothetical protein [Dyella sp.]
MKVYQLGEKGSALCHRDGRVTTTFEYRDLPFSDGNGLAKDILVGVCDICGDAIVIPAQSTPAIASARKRVEHPLEINIPSIYIELLDAASTRVSHNATPDFRKRLFVYYINRYAKGDEDISELLELTSSLDQIIGSIGEMPKKRLSMRLHEKIDERFDMILKKTSLNKTDLVKSIVAKIKLDLVETNHPKHLKELSTIAEVLYA